jgi:uncharacterized protein (TIGR00725 family)
MSRHEEGTIQTLKIGVSGSAVFDHSQATIDDALTIGRELAKRDIVVVTGDTTGIPYEAAKGAKKAGGFTVGISPAISYQEHVRKYKLPHRYTDFVMYTGFGYSGRNMLFIRSTDAVIFISGRIGTLNEFTIAFEDKKPIGILADSGGVSEDLDHILTISKRGRHNIVFENDPKILVEKVVAMARAERDRR